MSQMLLTSPCKQKRANTVNKKDPPKRKLWRYWLTSKEAMTARPAMTPLVKAMFAQEKMRNVTEGGTHIARVPFPESKSRSRVHEEFNSIYQVAGRRH